MPARLFTRDAVVLFLIARNPLIRYHEIAQQANVAERTVQRIVLQLEAAGYITRKRSTSLSAVYTVHRDRVVDDLTGTRLTVGHLIDALDS